MKNSPKYLKKPKKYYIIRYKQKVYLLLQTEKKLCIRLCKKI